MKTKYLLKLVALNLALTTVFAAALPSPSPSQSDGGGGGEHYKSMIANLSSVKIMKKMEEHAKHKEMLGILKQIEEGAKKGNAELLKSRTDLVTSFKADNLEGIPAGASDEEIFSHMVEGMEQEITEEMLAIAGDLHAGANPPAPGSRIH
ncbi:MAG: hypothetical protein NT128_00725 [Proteobacteria bacterium]|nr:hypothetical protein [Pseudomonadota bacterium]